MARIWNVTHYGRCGTPMGRVTVSAQRARSARPSCCPQSMNADWRATSSGPWSMNPLLTFRIPTLLRSSRSQPGLVVYPVNHIGEQVVAQDGY